MVLIGFFFKLIQCNINNELNDGIIQLLSKYKETKPDKWMEYLETLGPVDFIKEKYWIMDMNEDVFEIFKVEGVFEKGIAVVGLKIY